MGLGFRPPGLQLSFEVSAEAFQGFLSSHCPYFINWLTCERWDGGESRKLPTISLFVQDGLFKVYLNDKDQDAFACVSAASLEALLVTVDRKLDGGTMEWRRSKQYSRKPGK